MQRVEKHRAQQRIAIAERRERVHVRMHQTVEQDVRVRPDARAERDGANAEPRRQLADQCKRSNDDSCRNGRSDERVKEAVNRPVTPNEVIERLDVDRDLRAGEEQEREAATGRGLEGETEAAVKRCDGHVGVGPAYPAAATASARSSEASSRLAT